MYSPFFFIYKSKILKSHKEKTNNGVVDVAKQVLIIVFVVVVDVVDDDDVGTVLLLP